LIVFSQGGSRTEDREPVVSGRPRRRFFSQYVPKVGLGLVEVAPPVVHEVQVLPLGGGVSGVVQLQDRRAGQRGEQRGVRRAQDGV